jgi:hypothetical protein
MKVLAEATSSSEEEEEEEVEISKMSGIDLIKPSRIRYVMYSLTWNSN